jgi:polysaccharide biosynthesis protein PslG
VRRLLAALALLCPAALAAAPAADARPAREIAAVAVHPWQMLDPESRERTFDGIAAAGVRAVRIDMPWSWIERRDPAQTGGHRDWSRLDPFVEAATRRGLRVIGVMGYVPPWASTTGELWTYPNREPFEAFYAAALRHWPEIGAWELWNEPNLARFSKPGPDAARFVEFMRSARRAHDRVGSASKLISGGVAPYGGVAVNSWLDAVAIRGGLKLVDGFGMHPYSGAAPDDPRSWMMQLEALHERLGELGRPDLPIWLTEYGAPVMANPNGYGPALDEQQQAARLRTAYALATRYDWIENLTWYEFRDSCPDAADPECRFGVVRADHSRRPSFDALRAVTAGAVAQLQPRLQVSTKIATRRALVARASKRRSGKGKRRAQKVRRRLYRITVSGRLALPGTAWPNAVLTMLLPEHDGSPRVVRVLVKEGIFWARFEGAGLRPGTLAASYPGSPLYRPLTLQVPVATSVTTRR